MKVLHIGLLAMIVATGQLLAASSVVAENGGGAAKVKSARAKAGNTNDPVELEYQKLLEFDDRIQAEIDKMIETEHAFAEKGAQFSAISLQLKIDERLAPVRKAYEDFLQVHPKHARALIAYGSFLNDLNEEDKAVANWEKAKDLEPDNPAAWNNLANHYGHRGPSKKAFEYYAKAIELEPTESVYYHNYGTTVFLFRKDAQEYFKITEQEVFTKALELYRQAMKLDPTNFPLATDVAQTYYGISPTRTDDALAAWNDALKLAHDEIEREGVYIHLARFKMNAGRLAEAREHLGAVTNAMYADLKARVARNLEAKERNLTNSPPAVVKPGK